MNGSNVQTASSSPPRPRARFVVTKLRSWRTGYQRILCLYDSHFTTLDPESHFRETNSFAYRDIARQPVALPNEPNCFLIEFVNVTGQHVDKLKFRCEYCRELLTEFLALWTSFLHNFHANANVSRNHSSLANNFVSVAATNTNVSAYPTFQCHRLRRTGSRVPCLLRALPHAVIECDLNGNVLQVYRYLHIEQVGFTVDDPGGIVVHTTGRGRVFFVNVPYNMAAGGGSRGPIVGNGIVEASPSAPNAGSNGVGRARSDLASAMKRSADQIGVPFVVGQGIMLDSWLQLRAELGSDCGEAICSYRVTKPTRRHVGTTILRTLFLTPKYIVEKDPATGTVVSLRSLSSVFVVVRLRESETELCIEYKDGQSRTYYSTERDALACSILDACASADNISVGITEEKSDGHRLTPRDTQTNTSNAKVGFLENMFAGTSVEVSLISRLSHAASLLTGAEESTNKKHILDDVLEAASEFNANVPTSGVSPLVDKKTVASALPTIISVMLYLLSPEGSFNREVSEKSCATILQSVYRIVRCQAGFQAIAEIPDSVKFFESILKIGDVFGIFWSVKLLSAVVTCSYNPRDREQEFVNKQMFLGRPDIYQSLISLMIGVGTASGGWDEYPIGNYVDTTSTNMRSRSSVSDLVLVSTSELLESILCSGHDTTSPSQFEMVVQSISRG